MASASWKTAVSCICANLNHAGNSAPKMRSRPSGQLQAGRLRAAETRKSFSASPWTPPVKNRAWRPRRGQISFRQPSEISNHLLKWHYVGQIDVDVQQKDLVH